MNAEREDRSKPAWKSDELDSPVSPVVEAPYFDETLDAWVLSRHQDVLAAFRSMSLSPAGPRASKTPVAENEIALLKMREDTLEALSPAQLRVWRDQIAPLAMRLADELPESEEVDLMGAYARPVCLALATMVTGVEREGAERLREIAQPVSASAAEPYDEMLRTRAKAAEVQLQSCFHAKAETLRDSGFVAMSYTMPCLLANAWYSLLQDRDAWSLLHRKPELVEQAVEELLRYAGLTRILFRRATEDLELGGAAIRKGERIVLRLIAANRDPERFASANQMDLTRQGGGQLALGAGPHACVGASLIRMAAIAVTRPLVERFARGALQRPVEWQGGSGFRSPVSLPVRLHQDFDGQ